MGGGGGQGRCERRSEVFVKVQKNIFFWGGGSGRGGGVESGGVGVRIGGQGRCEQRSELVVKTKNEELKLL